MVSLSQSADHPGHSYTLKQRLTKVWQLLSKFVYCHTCQNATGQQAVHNYCWQLRLSLTDCAFWHCTLWHWPISLLIGSVWPEGVSYNLHYLCEGIVYVAPCHTRRTLSSVSPARYLHSPHVPPPTVLCVLLAQPTYHQVNMVDSYGCLLHLNI